LPSGIRGPRDAEKRVKQGLACLQQQAHPSEQDHHARDLTPIQGLAEPQQRHKAGKDHLDQGKGAHIGSRCQGKADEIAKKDR
jgi:hypothetical protein